MTTKLEAYQSWPGYVHDSIAEPKYRVPRSWYCQPCGVEVYSICCKHCGKTEGEAA